MSNAIWLISHLYVQTVPEIKTWGLPQAFPAVLSASFLPKFKSFCGGANQADCTILDIFFYFKLHQDNAIAGLLTQLTKTSCFSHSWRLHKWQRARQEETQNEGGWNTRPQRPDWAATGLFSQASELGCDSCTYVLRSDRKPPDSQACFYSTTVLRFLSGIQTAVVHRCMDPCQSVHICLCGWAALSSMGLLLHQKVMPSPFLSFWPLTFIERMAGKGRQFGFYLFWTKSYKHEPVRIW